ncbi:MAG: glycosyl hydrolase family 32 [Bacteroidales bacterium]|nr:glycosyl hydrolase family 32 [Bacteroidales bacterium]
MKHILSIIAVVALFCVCVSACGKNGGQGGIEGGSGGGSGTVDPYEGQGGYLFAHTGTGKNYYRLFYALSRDGIKWTALKRGESPMTTYYGFPYITRDADGAFWLIGTSTGSTPHFPIIWWSDDMITWKHKDLPRSIMDLPDGYENDTNSFGAMKIFFDAPSGQFIITWHANEKGLSGDARWESMRTFYILTKDFVTFTPAEKLFDFTGTDAAMAQIDASIHFCDGKYYAVIKDERWQASAPSTFKTIRIARSESLTGPWTNPGGSVTPAWREAPTLVQSPGGECWYLYVEDYTVHRYELYRSSSITNDNVWEKVTEMAPPPGDNCRHGCIIHVDEAVYKKLKDTYDK